MFSKPSLIANNPLGIVIQSVERPSGDTTIYTYTPAGRLESEVREGQVRYSRYYAYNLDGSRQWVLREDAVNGSHWDMYSYDEVSGRLASVQDVWTGEVNGFAWNPEGTLARWEEPNSYARVFGYDEEGRLVKIERDYGNGDVQVAYEYGYNSDGVRVWKQDVLAGQEYRYLCRIGCGGVPMRVYIKEFADTVWFSLSSIHAYLLTLLGGSQFRLMTRHIGSALFFMSMDSSQTPAIVYQDSFGIPFGHTPEIPNPSFLLPRDYPSRWIPLFPSLPLPVPGIGGIPRLPLPLPVPSPGIGGGMQHPLPAPNPPVVPPAPPGFPSPPGSPPPPGNELPEPPSACEKYESDCQGGGDYDFGECIFDCIMCCAEKCGPAAYSACAAGCPDEPGDCGVTVIDPPDIPEDIWDWLEKICELLQGWDVIPDDVPCKTIQWIPLL